MLYNPPPPGAAYRPDFYTPENIIGYTGSLRDNPTVYFKEGSKFGHITQSHSASYNVGREEVQEEFGGMKYVIENQTENGKETAVEKLVDPTAGGAELIFHKSRSKFIDVRRANIDVLAMLAQAIWKFPARKTKTRHQG